jgi:hypothetical protein
VTIRIIDPKECEAKPAEDGSCRGNEPAFAKDTETGAPAVDDPCCDTLPAAVDPCGDESYEESIGVELQCDIDEARREGYHVTGLRPYRVFLTWRRRNRNLPPNRPYQVIKRVELMPVNLVALDGTDLELTSVGLDAVGGITLTQISPDQVSDNDLRGKLDGRDLNASEEEFFYEVVHRTFPGQTEPPRRRYILVSEPHHDGIGFMYTVNLRAQAADVGKDGTTDQGLPPAIPRKRPELVS